MTEITIDYPGLSTQITQFVDIQLLLIIRSILYDSDEKCISVINTILTTLRTIENFSKLINDFSGLNFFPLHYAVLERRPIIAFLLLKYGAEPNIFDKYGNTPLNYTFWVSKRSEDEEEEINFTPFEGDMYQLVDCLIEHGANIGTQDKITRKFPLEASYEANYHQSSKIIDTKLIEILKKNCISESNVSFTQNNDNFTQEFKDLGAYICYLHAEHTLLVSLQNKIKSCFDTNSEKQINEIVNSIFESRKIYMIYKKDDSGETLLHEAIKNNLYFVARNLISKDWIIDDMAFKYCKSKKMGKLLNEKYKEQQDRITSFENQKYPTKKEPDIEVNIEELIKKDEQDNVMKPKGKKAKTRKQKEHEKKQQQKKLEKEKEEEKHQKLKQERLEQDKKEKEKLEKERLENEKEQERLENERLEHEKEQERLERERLEKEQERLEKKRLEKERLQKLEKERLEKEKLEKERFRKLEKNRKIEVKKKLKSILKKVKARIIVSFLKKVIKLNRVKLTFSKLKIINFLENKFIKFSEEQKKSCSANEIECMPQACEVKAVPLNNQSTVFVPVPIPYMMPVNYMPQQYFQSEWGPCKITSYRTHNLYEYFDYNSQTITYAEEVHHNGYRKVVFSTY